jgi:biofilm PGA synthesis protein PgaA
VPRCYRRQLFPLLLVALTSASPLPAATAAPDNDQIANEIRYGIIDRNTLHGAARFTRLDRAIRASDSAVDDFLAGQTPDNAAQRQLNDRLLALAARRRDGEVVHLYEAMQQRQISINRWSRRDVAGSYLARHQPEKARQLYEQLIADYPEDFEANLGLFYALLECEESDAATQHIDNFAARLPERRHLDGKYNNERLSADVFSDQARIYSDRLEAAEQRLQARAAAMPFNGEVRQTQAHLFVARGWPRQGEQMLQRALGGDPDNTALYADLSEVRLTRQNWSQARNDLEKAESLDVEHAASKRARESFQLYQKVELSIEAGFGRSQANGGLNNVFGNRDWQVDSRLYSAPLAERWRLFLHDYRSTSSIAGSNTTLSRSGLGLEWRWLDWQLSGELNGSEASNGHVPTQSPGLALSARWQANDQWLARAEAEHLSNEVSLRAVRNGIHADRLALGIDWQAHESRKLSLDLSRLDFSDGNQRDSLAASWQERWLSGPRGFIETIVGADHSRNSLRGTPYFNPENDQSLWLTVAADLRSWRRYDYSFTQRLALTAGRYWQQENNLPAAGMHSLEYAHRWELGRALAIAYHLGHSGRPYDGVRESRTYGGMSLLWRF